MSTPARIEFDPEKNLFSGYAAVYETVSKPQRFGDGGIFREVIRPGAFDNVVASGRRIVALVNHNRDKVLASTENGTLRLWSDNVGLRFEFDKDDTSYANDLAKSVLRKDVHECSFGMNIPQGGDRWEKMDGGDLHVVTEAEAYEISTGVAFPVYNGTSTYLRSEIHQEAPTPPPSTPALNAARHRLRIERLRVV